MGLQWKCSHTALSCYRTFRLLLILVFFLCPRWLKWTVFLVSTSKVTVFKNLYSFYIHTSDHRDGRAIRFFLHLNNQTLFYLWLYCTMRWTNQVLILRLFGSGLSNLIQGYLYLISLETVIGYRKRRGFQGTQVNLGVLLEKTVITYPSRNSYTESIGPSCRFSPKT